MPTAPAVCRLEHDHLKTLTENEVFLYVPSKSSEPTSVQTTTPTMTEETTTDGTTIKKSICSGGQKQLVGSYGLNDTLNERSLCPWYYTIDIDLNRKPERIPVALCHCPYCSMDHSVNHCERVYAKISVLRWNGTCTTDGDWLYYMAEEAISVACTCAQPRIAVHAPAHPQTPSRK